MQERIITASVLEDAEKKGEEIRGICAGVNQDLHSLADSQEVFLKTGVGRAIAGQIEDCLSGKELGEIRDSNARRPSLKGRNRPIRWDTVLGILIALGLFIERKNGSHVVIKDVVGRTVFTLAPEGKKREIKSKLLLRNLIKGGLPREEVVRVINEILG